MGVSILSLISAMTALVASIVSPFVTISTAKRQINASVISANRTRWLENLREQLACLVSEFTAAKILLVEETDCKLSVRRERKSLVDRIERLYLTIARVRLMLNTLEDDHVQLFAMISQALHEIRYNENGAELERVMDETIERILMQSQAVLKREWERVKSGL
jgi:hypothetical protein